MSGQREIGLSISGTVGPAVAFVLFGGALLVTGRADYPQLHTVLDTAMCLLSAVLTLMLWDRGTRTGDARAQILAASFALVSLLELTHALVSIEWSRALLWIAEAELSLRPATWPPAAYLLPIGVTCAAWISGPAVGRRHVISVSVFLVLLTAALLPLFYHLPRYSEPGWLGISRPTLILVPIIWAAAGFGCWYRRTEHRLLPALAFTAAILSVANVAMLYSREPHDTAAMVAHLGKVFGYLAFLLLMTQMASRDALARARAEQALAASHAEATRAIFETALDAVITMDDAGRITEFNPAAERIFGYRRDEVMGRPLDETIIPPELREAHRHGLARYLATGKAEVLGKRLELTALRADGATIAVELNVNRMPGSGPPQFSAFLRDVTARLRSDERLRAQLARLNLLDRITRAIGERQDLHNIFSVVLRSLEEHLPIDFGCVCLGEGAESNLSVACVGSASLPLSQTVGLTVGTEVIADQNGLAHCMRGKLAYEPDLTRLNLPLPTQLSRGGLHCLVAAPLLVESRVFGVLLAGRREVGSFTSTECEFLRQLTEHVALAAHQAQLYSALQVAYEDLRQTQQTVLQQERLRALGQMASGIAHDINNALSPAAIYTESLLERDRSLSTDTRKQLEIIGRAIDDVAHTVTRMREFSRPRESEMILTSVDLNAVLQQVLDLTRARWHDMPQERGLVIRVQSDLAGNLPSIRGAESEIRDAVTNLVLNAVDAMPDGGTITLRSHPSDNGTRVRIEVTDTGVGMSARVRSRCLEPFFTTKGERGTGLGLAMVYGMAQRHSAELEIDSHPGVGTTMRLTFLAAGAESATPPLAPRAGHPSPLRILLVDDDPLILKSLRDAFEYDGHTVAIADGGQRGIDTFVAAERRGDPFSVVITDLGMPHVDGRTVAAAIKSRSPSTPVVLLTGWGHRLIADQEVPEHVNRVLAKPPKHAVLRAVVSDLTAGPGAMTKPHG